MIDALESSYTHSSLTTFFRAEEVIQYDPGEHGGSKEKRLNAVVGGLVSSRDGHDRLLQMAKHHLEEGYADAVRRDHEYFSDGDMLAGFMERNAKLVEQLRSEGFDFVDGLLMPALPPNVPARQAEDALQVLLSRSGWGVAKRHYETAVQNFIADQPEGTNAQVRPFIEAFAIRLCEEKTGRRYRNGGAAIQALAQAQVLTSKEQHLYSNLFNLLSDAGPHPGLSSAEEARFRLLFASLFASYLGHRAGLLQR